MNKNVVKTKKEGIIKTLKTKKNMYIFINKNVIKHKKRIKHKNIGKESDFTKEEHVIINQLINLLKQYVAQTNLWIEENVIPLLKNLFVLFVKLCVNLSYYGLTTKTGIVLMIFGGIYGVVGVMSEGDTTPGQWFTFYCWSIVATATCLVPAFFRHKPMKEFLYERLGKEYVISRVGNPGLTGVAIGVFTGGLIQVFFKIYKDTLLHRISWMNRFKRAARKVTSPVPSRSNLPRKWIRGKETVQFRKRLSFTVSSNRRFTKITRKGRRKIWTIILRIGPLLPKSRTG